MTTPSQNPPAGAGDVQAAAQVLGEAIAEVQRVIVGQEHMVEQLMVSLLAKGHTLLEGGRSAHGRRRLPHLRGERGWRLHGGSFPVPTCHRLPAGDC